VADPKTKIQKKEAENRRNKIKILNQKGKITRERYG
jgi:hypothetical protein